MVFCLIYLKKKSNLKQSKKRQKITRQYFWNDPINKKLIFQIGRSYSQNFLIKNRYNFSKLKEFKDSMLPKKFDVREKWPQCSETFNIIPNQGACGFSYVKIILLNLKGRVEFLCKSKINCVFVA